LTQIGGEKWGKKAVLYLSYELKRSGGGKKGKVGELVADCIRHPFCKKGRGDLKGKKKNELQFSPVVGFRLLPLCAVGKERGCEKEKGRRRLENVLSSHEGGGEKQGKGTVLTATFSILVERKGKGKKGNVREPFWLWGPPEVYIQGRGPDERKRGVAYRLQCWPKKGTVRKGKGGGGTTYLSQWVPEEKKGAGEHEKEGGEGMFTIVCRSRVLQKREEGMGRGEKKGRGEDGVDFCGEEGRRESQGKKTSLFASWSRPGGEGGLGGWRKGDDVGAFRFLFCLSLAVAEKKKGQKNDGIPDPRDAQNYDKKGVKREGGRRDRLPVLATRRFDT